MIFSGFPKPRDNDNFSPMGAASGKLLRASKVVLVKGFLGIVLTCHDTCHDILFNKITS